MDTNAEHTPSEFNLPSKVEILATLSKNVTGQEAAIKTLAMYILAKIASRPREDEPPLLLLFCGPGENAKTVLATSIAETLNRTLVRFDMGDYAKESSELRFLGAPAGYVGDEEGGALPNAVREAIEGGNEELVILFDEIEKARAGIFQSMLAFFDEGRVTDANGTVVAPKSTIIIMTTNRLADQIAENPDNAKQLLLADGYLKPELIGRIQKTIPFIVDQTGVGA